MARERKPPTTTIRVIESLAEDLEVIADYIRDTTGKPVTVASLLHQWCKPHVDKYREKAYDHRIEQIRQRRERASEN